MGGRLPRLEVRHVSHARGYCYITIRLGSILLRVLFRSVFFFFSLRDYIYASISKTTTRNNFGGNCGSVVVYIYIVLNKNGFAFFLIEKKE